jgi:hypothetical protein
MSLGNTYWLPVRLACVAWGKMVEGWLGCGFALFLMGRGFKLWPSFADPLAIMRKNEGFAWLRLV